MSSPTSKWRRVVVTAVTATLTMLAGGTALMQSARHQLEREAERELTLHMSLRLAELQAGVVQLGSEMVLWSDFGRLKESVQLYVDAFHELGPDAGEILRRRYVTESPYPEGQRHFLLDADDGSAYSRLHAERTTGVRSFLEIHEYYDLFVIDADGNVVYSYFKEPDFGTNLLDGPYAESGLARAFREAKAANDREARILVDYSLYEPSGNAPALFVASPVFDQTGFMGVLAGQIEAAALNEILHFTEGMGETGETYAVGEDRLLRSDSRLTAEDDVLRLEVDTESVRGAFRGQQGVHRTLDHRGTEVLAAYGLLEAEGLRWAIVAQKAVAEIFAPLSNLRRVLLLTGLAVVLLVTLAALPSREPPDWLHAPLMDGPSDQGPSD